MSEAPEVTVVAQGPAQLLQEFERVLRDAQIDARIVRPPGGTGKG